ncbi:MAG TPA: cytochrome c peroxidase [Burkholderiaceae bacterium]|nr:cytochrome c peroxidase [Burkholderiaceae bacterium]
MRRARVAPTLPALAAGLALALALALGLGLAAAREPAPPAAPSARADVAKALGLSGAEVEAILAHGPWPPPFEPDPTNRGSGVPAAIELGRRLFVDRRLSGDGRRACIGCHRPPLGFSDGRARSPDNDGRPLDRNSPALLDARLHHWFGWDGAADSLWAFTLRPMADPRELATDDDRLAAALDGDPALACLRRAAFGERPAAPQGLRVQAAKALAAFVETLDSPRTPFDELRDALERGDAAAALAYPADALRGLRRFVGDARCSLCHAGPAFTNGEFHDTGRPFMAAPGRPDPGRHGGIRAVLADPHNRLGAWSDAADPAVGVRTRHLAPEHRNFGEFRVPGLRGAAFTAPYGHDGSLATLEDVIAHYADPPLERLHSDGESLLRPLGPDPATRAELAAFLRTLSARPRSAPPRAVAAASDPTVRACVARPAAPSP